MSSSSQWVLQINQLIDENALDTASQTPISIFQLPDSVHNDDNHPSSYLPRRVGLCPYHHFQPELQKMDLYKLGKAKNLETKIQLHQVLEQLKPLELIIRACFDKTFEMDGETLSWVMLINGLFLFEFLQKGSFSQRPMEFPLQVFYGKLFSEYEIVCDILMLENQIPLLVLKEILPNTLIENLSPLLYKFCESVTPFELPSYDPERACYGFPPNLPEIYEKSHHLLHFLYLLVLLIPNQGVAAMFLRYSLNLDSVNGNNFLSESLSILGSIVDIAFFQQLKETFSLILRLFKLLRSITKPNSVEEKVVPLIPSASELEKAGVRFKSTKNGVLKCRFERETPTPTLTLPTIHLDGFSRVILRNLVAYEAMAELYPACFDVYIGLMSGLLTNSKDVKILERAEIIYNHLESDEEVVKLFNGVKNSTSSLKKTDILRIHLKSEPNMGDGSEFFEEIMSNYEKGLKGMAEEINKCYESCWRVKMKKFVSLILKMFLILVIVFLMVFVIARFICSHISCHGFILKSSIAYV